jgi:hypothetical protein
MFTIQNTWTHENLSVLSSVSDPDPHSIGRPDPGGLKRAKMKKKRSKKPDN